VERLREAERWSPELMLERAVMDEDQANPSTYFPVRNLAVALHDDLG
jgi:hypothetical protein